MDKKVNTMIANNHRWARNLKAGNANYFKDMAHGQNPSTLWIGCSDSRVPAETLTGLAPGELFVHRNVANMVIHTDFNVMSVVQYAVDVLKVKDIVICGHSNCGGIGAAMDGKASGLISNWLMHIRDLYLRHQTLLQSVTREHCSEILTRLNVAQQIYNLGRSDIIQQAWARGQDITISGLVYEVSDGHLLEEGVDANSNENLETNYHNYIAKILTLTDQELDLEEAQRAAQDQLAQQEHNHQAQHHCECACHHH